MSPQERIQEHSFALVAAMVELPLAELVEQLNAVRESLHAISPFQTEPVDYVKWVVADQVVANDYNPNSVAPPEMELLRVSIMADGYTQPIVACPDATRFTVIDGFHRNRVGRECKDVKERTHGFLPIVRIRASQEDRGDRIASTIRHNRARGKHRVDATSDIIVDLKRRNWSDKKIGIELGMDPDEILRLSQISGLADMFADAEFKEAWEPGTFTDEDLQGVEFEDETE